MAIRKDLDDMLNSLRAGKASRKKAAEAAPKAEKKSVYDKMSVDDLLTTITSEQKQSGSAEVSKELAPRDIKEETAPAPQAEGDPIPVRKKKKIVISRELPDYEALRQAELEKERQAQRAAEEAEHNRRLAEEAERKRLAEEAERKRMAEEAERKRMAEEAERKRMAEEAERKRLAEEAERKRMAEEAERKRLAEEAERKRLAEEAERKRMAEEAERKRLAEEAERKRLAEEAERKRLAEEAERKRLAEEAERKRMAEEAERKRMAEEAERKRLAEEAERKRLAEEAERKRLAEEAERKRLAEEAERKRLAEEAEQQRRLNEEAEENSSAEEVQQQNETVDPPEETEKPKRSGFFKKKKHKVAEEAPVTEEQPMDIPETAPEDGLFEPDKDAPSATELIDAAIAAINEAPVIESEEESDPVGNMLENMREDAAEAIAEIEHSGEKDTAEPLVLTDDDIIAGLTPELKKRFDELSPDKQQQIIDMRRSQLGGVAPEPISLVEELIVNPVASESKEKPEETPEAPSEKSEEAAEEPKAPEKKKGKVITALENILDEDPDELVAARKENTEEGGEAAADPNKKKRLYTVLGVIFAIFALIGVIATIAKCVGLARSFTSGEVKKDSFTQMIYPAAIMDIEAFDSPSELTSEQIITATIWSVIMDDSKISKYEITLDTVSIPDIDVEKYAVELFGENIPSFEHCTVGPMESRFYYSEGAYNVKVKPITHTYAPEIKSIVKSGSEYTLTVDYIDELPQWMDKTVAKTVEFHLIENEDGSFRYSSMRTVSVNISGV